MARRSKLTEQQWNEILDRNLAGESIRSLAKEYGISAMAVQKKISLQAEKVKTVANQVVITEKAVSDLPVSLQRACNAFCGHLSEKGRNPFSEFDTEPIQC